MKDWRIVSIRGGHYALYHIHNHNLNICRKNDVDDWRCVVCGDPAPEEIAFAADLARCLYFEWITPQDRAKGMWKVEK